MNRFIGRWCISVTFAAALVAALVWARVRWAAEFDVHSLIRTLKAAATSGWAAPAYCTAFLVGSSLFLPAVLFFAVAGATFGTLRGALLAWATVNVISNLHFLLGRKLGKGLLVDLLERHRNRLGSLFEGAQGISSMVVVRQLPLPFLAVNLAAGASQLPWRHFAVGNAIGLVPNCLLYSTFAAEFVSGATGHLGLTNAAVAALVVLLALGLRFALRPRSA